MFNTKYGFVLFFLFLGSTFNLCYGTEENLHRLRQVVTEHAEFQRQRRNELQQQIRQAERDHRNALQTQTELLRQDQLNVNNMMETARQNSGVASFAMNQIITMQRQHVHQLRDFCREGPNIYLSQEAFNSRLFDVRRTQVREWNVLCDTYPAFLDTRPQLPEVAEKYFVGLSIDGGGIKGLVSNLIMTHIEDLTGKKMIDLVDLLGGSSVGGMLAAGIAVTGGNDIPLYDTKYFLNFFKQEAKRIFPNSWWNEARSLFTSKYSPVPLENTLQNLFGDKTLLDVVKPLVVPALTTNHVPFIFSTKQAQESVLNNFYLRDVCRAASAAPVYFPAARIRNIQGNTEQHLVDSGLNINNPAYLVYKTMKQYYQSLGCTKNNSVILSLGTGNGENSAIPHASGGIDAEAIIAGLMNSTTNNVNQQLLEKLGSRFLRINPMIGRVELDATEDSVLSQLEFSVETVHRDLEPISRFLAENHAR